MADSSMTPVKESATLPFASMKNEVGMYWKLNLEASCWADASSVMAFTNEILPS